MQLAQKLSGCLIEEEIGGGGFATVYAARAKDNRRVAIKVLHENLRTDEALRERFDRELAALHELKHPNVLRPISEEVALVPVPHFVMELVSGRSLSSHLADGPMPLADASRLLTSLADALDAAHALEIVHRDIKASNVLLAEPDLKPVLIDFGIARLQGRSALTRSTQLIGSLISLAPEQICGGKVDASTDVYGLGSLAFHILSGAPPFSDEPVELMEHMHRFAKRPLVSAYVDIDPRVDEVVSKAMAIKPEDRYSSAGQMATAMRKLVPCRRAATATHEGLALLLRGPAAQVSLSKERLLGAGFHPLLEGSHAVIVARACEPNRTFAQQKKTSLQLVDPAVNAIARRGEIAINRAGIPTTGSLAELSIWSQET
jgi:serine/threonine-protein kinase